MSRKPTDPLLGVAKLLTILSQAVMAIAAAGVTIGIGALLTVARDKVFAKIAEAGAPDLAFPLLILALALIVLLLVLGWRFFRELAGIIDSVGEGEPFRTDNADRLSRMGWIAVGAHLLALVLAGMAVWFVPYLAKLGEGGGDGHFGFGVDGGGILLTVILFILARVFREGARMREELEGTV